MFTGIIEEVGTVVELESLPDAARLRVSCAVACDAAPGESISVNGVCLTIVRQDAAGFTADVMASTLHSTALGRLQAGSRVNLERALRLGDRLGGHLVQGHVDGVGEIRSREAAEHWELVRISLPPALARYVVVKGSITVDGTSLTVVEVGGEGESPWFSVSLIPTTLELTTLGRAAVGSPVNLEVDIIGKYVERLLAAGA